MITKEQIIKLIDERISFYTKNFRNDDDDLARTIALEFKHLKHKVNGL